MRLVPIFALLAIAGPVAAQDDRRAEALDLIERSLAEQRLFLTCSSLDPETHTMILGVSELWRLGALETLREVGWQREEISDLDRAMDPRALLPDPDTPFAEVRDLCMANPDWLRRYHFIDFIILERELSELYAAD